MENYIINLIIVVSFSVYMIQAWFKSTLSAQVINLFLKNSNKLYTKDDVENYLLNKSFFVYSLLTCPICLSFHLSLWSTIFVYLCRYIIEGKSQDPFQAIATLFISASIASNFGGNDKIKEVEKELPKELAEKPDTKIDIKKQTKKSAGFKVVNTKKSNNEQTVEDFGGYLVETSKDGKKIVVGTTRLYSEYISNVFDETKKCNFPRCQHWRDEFKKEIDELDKKHKEKGKHCPECIKSGVKRKFYDIIKDEIESLKKNEST